MKRFPTLVAIMGSTVLTFQPDASWAQAASTWASAPDEQPGQSSQLEDIVVTAQRRSEPAQKVPIAITTLAPATIERQGIQSGFELTKAVPGLVFSSSSGYATPFIRGIGSTNAQLGDEASIATYIDGVYQTNRLALSMPYGTVSSVEVLKGPQGTLFGRNAVGGVINVTLRGPEQTFGGTAALSYDNYRALEASVFVTGPLSDKASASLDVQFRNQERGFFRNSFDGRRLGVRNYDTYRGKLRLEPTESLTINLSADYQHSVYDLNNLSGTLPGTVPLGALFGDRYPKKPLEVYTDVAPDTHFESYGASATIGLDLGGVSLKSITSYRRIKLGSIKRVGSVPDGTRAVTQTNTGLLLPNGTPVGTRTIVPGSYVLLNNSINPYIVTQELQLASDQGRDFEWILGGFAQWNKEGYQKLRIDFDSKAALPLADYTGSNQRTEAYAAFAQGTFHLNPELSLVGGLRYSAETKSTTGRLFVGGALVDRNEQSKTFHGLSYRAGVNYQANPNALFYASASRGFKSGLFIPLSFRAAPVKPERLDDYEVGAKLDINRSLRINVSGFHYIYKNQQVNAVLANGLTFLTNAASSRLTGGELEVQAIPVHNLTLGFSSSYIHARYHSFTNAQAFLPSNSAGYYQATIDASGNPIIQTPTWSGKGSINYRVDLANGSKVNLGANYYRSGSFSWDYSNRTRNPAYGVLDLSLEWVAPNERYSVLLYGNNVTNTKYAAGLTQTVQGSLAFWGRPAVFGARFRVNLD